MNRRTRHLWVIALVAVVLPVAVLADTPAAGAAIPEWAYELAEETTDFCVEDLPEAIIGSGTATVGYVAPKIGGNGLTFTASGGSAAAGGSVALTAAKGAAVAGFAVGIFCTTVAIGDWLFGRPEPGQAPGEDVTSTGLRPCIGGAPTGDPWVGYDLPYVWSQLPGRQDGDYCATLHVPGANSVPENWYAALREIWMWNPGVVTYYYPMRGDDGEVFPTSLCTDLYLDSGCGKQNGDVPFRSRIDRTNELVHVVVPCASPEVHCGVLRNVTASGGNLYHRAPMVQVRRGTTRWGHWPLDEELLNKGGASRMRSSVRCKRPSDGDEITEESHSAIFFDVADGGVEWQAARCPTGYAPIRVRIYRQSSTGGGLAPVEWDNGSPLLSWNLPTSVQNNPTTLACFLEGITNCPMYDENPDDPNAKLHVGGQGGVKVDKGGRTVKTDTVPEVLAEVPWPENDPREEPAPSTTTTAVPTTTPGQTTTIAPPEDPENCVGAHCVGGPGAPPPESEGSECWPSGWGWLNPVEWVLRPIKCALMWAFWDQDSADEMAALGSEHGWTQAVTQSSVNTDPAAGPCLQLEHGAEICTEPILSYELPSVVEGLVAAVVLFLGLFEVVGLFARITGG